MNISIGKLNKYVISIAIGSCLIACSGDPMQSGLDLFAPMVFKEGGTTLPLNGPNKSTLQPFYVSPGTVFKFAVDTSSILIAADGVTRYTVVITNPSGGEQKCSMREFAATHINDAFMKHLRIISGLKALSAVGMTLRPKSLIAIRQH